MESESEDMFAEADMAESGPDDPGSTRKRKAPEPAPRRTATVAEMLQVYDDLERNVKATVEFFQNRLLPTDVDDLSAGKLAKLPDFLATLTNSIKYWTGQRRKQKLSKDHPKFNRTWVDCANHSLFQSSQENEEPEPISDDDDPSYMQGDEASEEMLAGFHDSPGMIMTQDSRGGEEALAQSTQAPSNYTVPLHMITSSAGRINRLKFVRGVMETEAIRQLTTVAKLSGAVLGHDKYHPKKDEHGNVVEPADRELAKVGMAILNGEPVCQVHKATIREGVYATDRLRLTSTGYRGLTLLTRDRFKWPCLNEVQDFKKEVMSRIPKREWENSENYI